MFATELLLFYPVKALALDTRVNIAHKQYI